MDRICEDELKSIAEEKKRHGQDFTNLRVSQNTI